MLDMTNLVNVDDNINIQSDDNSNIQSWIVMFPKFFHSILANIPDVLLDRLSIKYRYKIFNAINLRGSFNDVNIYRTLYPAILSVIPDQLITINTQTTGAYISRIGATCSSQVSGNGSGLLSSNTNINVFIVDTGISSHNDLNIVGGINFTSIDSSAWSDGNGHGTHVSGIAGSLDNSNGVVGVAPGVRLWAVKVLDDSGNGYASDIIAGLDWILNNRSVLWNGKGIVNMSIGGAAYTPLDTAVGTLISNGIIPVVAAGNETQDVINFSPARVLSAITVGATENYPNYDTLASYSNYGSRVDILAPGTSITSTWPTNTYATLSGTSMATPVVTGTIALILSTQTIAGGNTSSFVSNVRTQLYNSSLSVSPVCYGSGSGSNPRITIPSGITVTNVSVWAGKF